MRSAALLVAALAALASCRRHRGPRRPLDPRRAYATGCIDHRYVNAPAVPAPGAGPTIRRVVTARVGAARLFAWATDAGTRLWGEGQPDAVPVTGPLTAGELAMGATGERALLAWVTASGALQVAGFDAGGAGQAHAPMALGALEMALATSRGGALVAWRDAQGTRARRLDARGAPRGDAFAVAGPEADAPAVARAGGRWVVAWRARAEGVVRMRTISDEGAAGPVVEAVRATGALGPPAVRWGNGRLAVAWSDERHGPVGLMVTTVSLAGRPYGEPQRLSARFEPGARASMAWDGAAFGVAWWEPVGGAAPRSYLALVDRDGRRMGSAMRCLTDVEGVGLALPVVDWDRPQYVVAAVREGAEVEVRRTGPLGCDMPPAPPEGGR